MRTRPGGVRTAPATHTALVTLALGAVLVTGVLAACSSPSPAAAPPASAPAASAPISAVHDGADVAFAQGMIPHHRQAVVMSSLAAERAASPEVTDLAARIAAEQDPEIERMNAMLDAWSAPRPPEDAAGMPSMAGMAGMLTDAQLGELAARSGPEFDRMFLQLMIEHHRGAVQMAQAQQAQGANPEALDLAASIVAAQEREIGEMRALLGRV